MWNTHLMTRTCICMRVCECACTNARVHCGGGGGSGAVVLARRVVWWWGWHRAGYWLCTVQAMELDKQIRDAADAPR